jgi:hypothetical protein
MGSGAMKTLLVWGLSDQADEFGDTRTDHTHTASYFFFPPSGALTSPPTVAFFVAD